MLRECSIQATARHIDAAGSTDYTGIRVTCIRYRGRCQKGMQVLEHPEVSHTVGGDVIRD